jgi:AcrR family transcriptional regulator
MNTREKLIETAGRMFAERGFDGVSVRDIVRAAGANLGAVTYHFGGKEALFVEVIMRKTERLRDLAIKIIAGGDAPDVKLSKLLEAYALRILCEEPSLKVMFREMISGGVRMPRKAVESVDWRNKIFADVVKDGIRQGIFRPCDIWCAAWSFFGMLSSYILYQPLAAPSGKYRPHPREYVKRIVRAALDIFLNGLRVRRERAPAAGAGRRRKKKI